MLTRKTTTLLTSGLLATILCSFSWLIADAQESFVITYPTNGGTVKGEKQTIKGKGAPAGSRIVVTVTTDKPYPQKCTFKRQADGGWSCGIVYFSGEDEFQDHHTLEVELIVNEVPLKAATAADIKRR